MALDLHGFRAEIKPLGGEGSTRSVDDKLGQERGR